MNKIFIRLIGGNIQTNHVGIIILYFVINVEWKLRMKNELSESYKLGYKIGFYVALMLIRKHCDDEDIIDKLIEDYNKQPLIDRLNINIKEFLYEKVR